MVKQKSFDLFGKEITRKYKLRHEFIFPPFSVLNTREGIWQRRKREWISLGIKGELGRANNVLDMSATVAGITNQDERNKWNAERRESPKHRKQKLTPATATRCWLGGKETPSSKKFRKFGVTGGSALPEMQYSKTGERDSVGTSIFDPVLCELAYRWFCPAKGKILDPFAGGSTRGVVASVLGYDYTGIEIRKEQIKANEEQAEKIKVNPKWILGDSYKINKLLPKKEKYDLIFTSPPYYDLEVYSEMKNDGSAKQTYQEFIKWYEQLFTKTIKFLNQNRFLVVQVGEIRDKKGVYQNFVGDTITCFKNMGLYYYNEIILVTSVGSLPIRAGRIFRSSRKIGKTHQNILVFYKGDLSKIKKVFRDKK